MSLQVGWNLDKAIDLGSSSTLNEVAWQTVHFDNSSKIFVPKNRGVYIVSVNSDLFKGSKPFSLFQTPAYIGHSIDLRHRFDSHTAGSEPESLWRRLGRARKFCSFWYAVFEKPKSDLKLIEQHLIDIYGSPLNRINSVRLGTPIMGSAD